MSYHHTVLYTKLVVNSGIPNDGKGKEEENLQTSNSIHILRRPQNPTQFFNFKNKTTHSSNLFRESAPRSPLVLICIYLTRTQRNHIQTNTNRSQISIQNDSKSTWCMFSYDQRQQQQLTILNTHSRIYIYISIIFIYVARLVR